MSKTPTLFDSLSQAAREDREAMSKLDERWDRLAAGTLTEAENDELLGLADASGEAFEAYQAFKPLGPSFQKNVAAAILVQQAGEREAALAATEQAEETDAGQPPLPDAAAPPKRKLIFGSLGGLLGVAMAAIFAFPSAPLTLFTAKQLAGLPAQRGGEATAPPAGAPPVYYPDNEITLEATAPPTGDDLEARLYAAGEDGRLDPEPAKAQIGKKGAVLSFGPLTVGRDLHLSPGRWRLLVVVARQGKFPELAEIRATALAGAPTTRYWQLLEYPLVVGTEPSLDELEVR